MPPAAAVQGLAWVTRNFPHMPGWWRLAGWLDQQRKTLAQLPPQTVKFAGDFLMRVRPEDENGRRVFIHGFEPAERLTRHFVRLLRPGDCVIDIGANVGYYTLTAAKLVGPTGCVHAFEAAPKTLELLRANAAMNSHVPIRVHPEAVTDRCGATRFFTAGAEETGYSSIRDLGAGAATVDTVRTLTIDSLLGELPPVRLVKLDIEGAELMALRGMAQLIKRDEPFIITEIDDQFLRQLGYDAQQQCDFLTERGYALYRIVERGELKVLHTPPTDRCNLLACPPGVEGLALAQPVLDA